ncbi:MAG: Uma2 family endonuclease [Anaerolineae bacterium]|nr:Uma2 family endonuclease [Anaerolineae bacterium]
MADTEVRDMPEEIIAQNISFEDYMAHYAAAHTEWVGGMVIKMSPVTLIHDSLSGFWYLLMREFLEQTRLGQVFREPFVMRITPESPAREPDLQIVLKDRAGIIQETMTAGAADVVIEIISKESVSRDRGEKFEEYEAGGVREYWLCDPLRQQADFYVLGDDGLYRRIDLKEGVFASVVLAGFRLDTGVLWQKVLPTGREIMALVDAMLKE